MSLSLRVALQVEDYNAHLEERRVTPLATSLASSALHFPCFAGVVCWLQRRRRQRPGVRTDRRLGRNTRSCSEL